MNEEQVCVVRRRRNRAEVEQLVAEYETSGMSRSEFCRERGLALSTLGRYRRGQERQAPACANPLLAVELSGRPQASVATAGSALAGVALADSVAAQRQPGARSARWARAPRSRQARNQRKPGRFLEASTRDADKTATAATGLHRPFGSFSFFFRGVRRPVALVAGALACSCVLAERADGEQNSHGTRQWTPWGRRRHWLYSTNGRSRGQSTGTTAHTAGGQWTSASNILKFC
jgi:hypothetical protein